MEKEQFVNVVQPWWLLVENIEDSSVKGARDKLTERLVADLSYPSEWYKDATKVDEIFTTLQSKKYELVGNKLDEAANQLNLQVEWIQAATDVLAPPKTAAEDDASAAAAKTPATAAAPAAANAAKAEWDDGWQMLRRLRADNTYEYAFSADKQSPNGEWMAPDQATVAKQNAQSAQQTAANPQAAQSAAANAAAAAQPPVWDSQWGMFRRLVDGNYEYALSNMLADGPGTANAAGEPDGAWKKTQEEAAAARNLVAGLKDTLNEMVQDTNIPLDQQQVNQALRDPNFQQDLAAAQAELDRELAALESEG